MEIKEIEVEKMVKTKVMEKHLLLSKKEAMFFRDLLGSGNDIKDAQRIIDGYNYSNLNHEDARKMHTEIFNKINDLVFKM